MEFLRVKALWPEHKGFHLNRESTGEKYVFVHLQTPCELLIGGSFVKTKEGACVIFDRNSRLDLLSTDCDLLYDYFIAVGDLEDLTERYGLAFGKPYYPRFPERVTLIVQSIEQECLKQAPFYKEYCDVKLSELLILLSRSDEAQGDCSPSDSVMYDRFIALRRKIHENFDGGLTVADMAAMVNLSPSRFYSVYKNIFGISPKKDYLNIRIEHAKTLLLLGDYTVEQVAAMAGYNNPFHFIRQFKELTGTTPGRYQKEARKQKK